MAVPDSQSTTLMLKHLNHKTCHTDIWSPKRMIKNDFGDPPNSPLVPSSNQGLTHSVKYLKIYSLNRLKIWCRHSWFPDDLSKWHLTFPLAPLAGWLFQWFSKYLKQQDAKLTSCPLAKWLVNACILYKHFQAPRDELTDFRLAPSSGQKIYL